MTSPETLPETDGLNVAVIVQCAAAARVEGLIGQLLLAPKFPLADMARATRGPATAQEHLAEVAWREQLMRDQRDPYAGEGT